MIYATPDIFISFVLTLAQLREMILEETDGKDSEIHIFTCSPGISLYFFPSIQKAEKLH